MKAKLIRVILLFLLLQSSYLSYAQQDKINSLKSSKASLTPDLALGSFLIFSVLNPILLYEDKKVYFGISRELTLGFGKNGEYRISAEYSYIFRKNLKHHLRLSAKYDILWDFSKSDWFDTRYVLSIGAGYFIDAYGKGISPEITGGIRLWDDRYITIPYVKLRHTFMITKDKPGNSDISLGMIIGYRPF